MLYFQNYSLTKGAFQYIVAYSSYRVYVLDLRIQLLSRKRDHELLNTPPLKIGIIVNTIKSKALPSNGT